VELKDKVAVITGAGSGIGRATAQRLAAEGAAIMVADVNEAAAVETAKLIEGAGGRAACAKVDVTDAEETQKMLDAAVAKFGRLDILYNNAGIAVGVPPFPRTELHRWRRVLDIDLQAVVLGTYLAAPIMEHQGGGVIIHTASMAGLYPHKDDPVYGAAKAGVVQFTYSLAPWAARLNIRVNCVCPGVVDTPLVRSAIEEASKTRYRVTMPAKIIQPNEIAKAVLHLIRDDSLAGRALEVRPSGTRLVDPRPAPGSRR
jgi:NAD(P)-dependent dehydrogenase (short-subunit alcohol dehydrogenase family)